MSTAGLQSRKLTQRSIRSKNMRAGMGLTPLRSVSAADVRDFMEFQSQLKIPFLRASTAFYALRKTSSC
ncbi:MULTISPECIES: hypothetical protein [unclassified Marinomonas]|uniref:hypothetical protein n=1 Tax=unclassified Marinomonas TaxID=196814 RepID=UPI0012FD9174|nr:MULTISPECIES: hypothetical protein [unclassified Marinomonas]